MTRVGRQRHSKKKKKFISYHTKFPTYSYSPIKLFQAVMFQTSIREVPNSNLRRNTDYSA